MSSLSPLKIAVIGSGVAGLTAAYLLQQQHRVTLLEKASRLGGHTHTVLIPEGPDAGTPVDMGFIVFNDRTYPAFSRFLARLDVSSRYSDMSFSFHCPQTKMEYAGTSLGSLFARPANWGNLSHWRMLLDILRFNRRALQDLATESGLGSLMLEDYLSAGRYGHNFRENYLLPMGAAIWSTPAPQMLKFPAASFLQFFKNHGLLTVSDRPRWQTVQGGSHSYIKALEKQWDCEVLLRTSVEKVFRGPRVRVRLANGEESQFDKVVIAAHADEALAMLGDPSPEEHRLLSAWLYQRNLALLHSDPTFMPRRQKAWASWNYRREAAGAGGEGLSVTYDMNRLQGLQTSRPYFVTLNPRKPPADHTLVASVDFTHPVYTFQSLESQKGLPLLNGIRNTFFCGSYFRHGFHEDAVQSALAVGKALGVEL